MTGNVLHNIMEPFENPDLLPLEDLKLKVKSDGVAQMINALSEKWADSRYFLHYEAPVIYNDDESEISGAKERWMEIVGYIIDDLKWLLRLPFYRFWSNIVYNTSILDTLVSFLQEAPPFYALENFPNIPEMLEVLETLRRYVLVLFARLITNKQSASEYMSRPFLGKLLYDNYIFTVPIIFDLCQLYGRENDKTVERILQSLFTLQPQYHDDLEKSVPCLIEALRNVEQRFEDCPIHQSGEVAPLPDRTIVQITLPVLEDMLIYVLDVASTVSTLLKLYPAAVNAFHKEPFMTKTVLVYENTIPEMYKRLNQLAYNDDCMPKYIELKHRLDVTRIELLQLYRTIIYHPLKEIQEKMEGLTEEEIKRTVDDYLTILSNATSEKEFITDYHQFYPVDSDLNIILTICPEMDTIKFDYILQLVFATIADNKTPATGTNHNSTSAIEAVAGPSDIEYDRAIASSSCSNNELCKKTTARKSSVEVASLVSEVKDILYGLGEGFIEMCLKHYNYDTATVINAVLEGSLPPNLKEVDQTLPHIPTDEMEPSVEVDKALGSERLNVFDNDEFDIMTRDNVDMSRIYLGKKSEKHKNINELLNDKTDVKKAEDIYTKFSYVTDQYDDEYDDTYDGLDVGGAAQDDAVETDAKSFVTPRVLAARHKNRAESESDSESGEEPPQNEQNGRDCFVQNPADVRAKAEQRRQAMQKGKSHNVTGKPKGHGQDKEVIINRDQKNTHKAQRANNNRRSGAQWKRRQGMIPS